MTRLDSHLATLVSGNRASEGAKKVSLAAERARSELQRKAQHKRQRQAEALHCAQPSPR